MFGKGDFFLEKVIATNYEKLVSELTNELQTLKSEQDALRIKVSTVLEENNRLAKELKEVSSPNEYKDVSIHSEQLVKKLQQQIHSLLLEKEEITRSWHDSLKSVEILENELKSFQNGTQDFVPKNEFIKVKQNYEDKLGILQGDLDSTRKKLGETMRNASKELSIKYQDIDKSLENQSNALKIVKNLEDEVLALQNRLQELEKSRAKLQRSLKQNEDEIKKLPRKILSIEKRENEAKAEMQKINVNLNDVLKEMEEKMCNEITRIKSEYSGRYEDLTNKYNKVQDEMKVKSLEIEKFATKCALLENVIDKFRKGDGNIHDTNISKLLILEKNLESTFQKLLVSEKQNIQLISEKETMKNDMEQMAGHYERTLKTKEIEKLTLQNKIKQLETSLDDKDLTLKRSNEKMRMEEEDKILMQKDFKQQLENQERIMAQVQADKMIDLTKAYTEQINQLHNQLDSKEKISKHWMNETKIIVEKLEKFVGDLKGEVRKLKKENMKLKEELQLHKTKFEQYKHFLQIISQDVNKISYKAVDNG
ncbi:hypothetical protein JTB14_020991 [Gonioctena quinquepunctata]|nr:hypothetical protein JTB14_020991 [Gonioctena quinquepunctata]